MSAKLPEVPPLPPPVNLNEDISDAQESIRSIADTNGDGKIDLQDVIEDIATPKSTDNHKPIIQIIAAFVFELIGLFKVRTIITFAVVGTMCILVLNDRIATEAFMGLAGSIITYYFTRRGDRND